MTASFLATLMCVTVLCSTAFAGSRGGDRNVTDYGARGDGQTLNTEAFHKAVAECGRSGGGCIVVPPGTFVTGPIELGSNMELHLQAGAVLEGTVDLEAYKGDGAKRGVLFARGAENVVISGPGSIHGNGTAFMEPGTPKGLEHTTGRYTRQGEAYRVGMSDGPMIMRQRPGSLIRFTECRNILIHDVTLKDAPEWTVTISDCDLVDLRGIRISNNLLIPNNDGIHCVTSRNVHISDCDIQAGDDAIAITGLWGRSGAMAEDITVTNCTLLSRSSGVRVGYGSNSIRRCVFQNLVIHQSNRGLGIFVRDEGSVTDVLFSNIIIETRLHTGWWGNGEPIHVSCLPQKKGVDPGVVENVRFSNIMATSEHGIVIWGIHPEAIRKLSISDVNLTITASPLNDAYGGNFDLRPACEDRYSVFKHDIPGLYARGVTDLRVDRFRLEWAEALPSFFSHGIQCEDFMGVNIDGFMGRPARAGSDGSAIHLERGRDISIRNCKALPGTTAFVTHRELSGPRVFVGNDLTCARQTILPDRGGFTFESNVLKSEPSGPGEAASPPGHRGGRE